MVIIYFIITSLIFKTHQWWWAKFLPVFTTWLLVYNASLIFLGGTLPSFLKRQKNKIFPWQPGRYAAHKPESFDESFTS